jgi:hypothetical protein
MDIRKFGKYEFDTEICSKNKIKTTMMKRNMMLHVQSGLIFYLRHRPGRNFSVSSFKLSEARKHEDTRF